MINYSSPLPRTFSLFALITAVFLTLFCGHIYAQSADGSLPDSLLKEQLTRAVQSWKTGKPLPAYQTLDTIISQPLSAINASSKVKAAIWTATYLQEQKKLKPASKFLDSAMTWASQYARGEELRRSYEAYSNWHLANGNVKSAMAAQSEANKISDSLNKVVYQVAMDSLKKINTTLQNKIDLQAAALKPEEVSKSPDNNDRLIWIMGFSILILLILVFLLNGKVQRLNSAPPVAIQRKESAPKINVEKQEIKNNVSEIITPVSTTEKVVAKAISVAPTKEILNLTTRLSAVELILIRADIFAEKVNGESKLASKTLYKYVEEFPLMMKNLDDAISNNDADAILKSTVEFRTPLDTFGMSGTVLWIDEIKAEAHDAKVNKLLSRVFQVRNHVRRALDEAKAILEKVNL